MATLCRQTWGVARSRCPLLSGIGTTHHLTLQSLSVCPFGSGDRLLYPLFEVRNVKARTSLHPGILDQKRYVLRNYLCGYLEAPHLVLEGIPISDRRRHLSVGQKSAIALEWAEQVELIRNRRKIKGRGRPRGALTEVAKDIGINEQRVLEVR